jgi:ABC-type polysaccharide/polyol phosphate transport system ATPase subunit
LPTLPEGTIQAHHVWKRFRADRRYSKLRYEMEHVKARLRGGGDEDWRWALRDVDLEVAPGESIGLIGSNGSGKSTLLKVLCRVMRPHSGSVEVSGRVGALIEVVAGIHPDLSGRENAFLYGTLLGLDRQAVASRFDEIVEFAELGDAIDRQVKFYSSGMKMRLGFSVAAFLEPDVLLVDEVLAVGDAAFQQKCLERMRLVLDQGTTLVFVSHDLAAMEATCTRGVWLQDGVAQMGGPIRSVLSEYRRAIESAAEGAWDQGGPVRIAKLEVVGPESATLLTDEQATLTMRLESQEHFDEVDVFVGISEGPATPIFLIRHGMEVTAGESTVECVLPRLPLPRGRFYVWVSISHQGTDIVPWHPGATVDVIGPFLEAAPRAVVRLSPVHVPAQWQVLR